MYCANSTNYIANDNSINIKYLLGVLNSSLVNFFIKTNKYKHKYYSKSSKLYTHYFPFY